MKKIKLAILEEQQEYASLFWNYIKEKKERLFQVYVFTKEETLEAHLEREQVDLLLLSSNLEREKWEDRISCIVVLSDQPMLEQPLTRQIYKFQSAESILKQLYEIFMEEKPKQLFYLPREGRICEQYAMFSPYGGSGKTTCAMVLGYLLEQGRLGTSKKVLVVSLEPGQKSYTWKKVGESKGISEAIYYALQGEHILANQLPTLVTQVAGVDYLSGARHICDLEECSLEDMEKLIHILTEETSYDVIIYDISYYGKCTYQLLENCKWIWETSIGKAREISYEAWLGKSKAEQLKKKIGKICLPALEHGVEQIELCSYGAIGKTIEATWKEQKDGAA